MIRNPVHPALLNLEPVRNKPDYANAAKHWACCTNQIYKNYSFTTGVMNLRPAWLFLMGRIRIFVTQFKVQNRVETKLTN